MTQIQLTQQSQTNQLKHTYLSELTRRISTAGKLGLLSKQPFAPQVHTISGPRAAAALISAGQCTGETLKSLTKSDNALLRQLVPFAYDDHTIAAFLHRWYVRIEAGWPRDLQCSTITLSSINKHPLGNGHWVTGVNETGTTVIASLDNDTPHWIIAGQTGSGKTEAIQNHVYKLAQAGDAIIILIDGKHGESLGELDALPCVLGPCAVDLESARGALSYAIEIMTKWYERPRSDNETQRVVVVFDEFQEFASDKTVAHHMRQLVSLGRAASVHCVFATQHPINSVLGDPQTKRNIPGRLVFKVTDFAASHVAIGQETPRADRLTGCGDCYCRGERVQGALVTMDDFAPLLDKDRVHRLDWYSVDANESMDIVSREPQYTVDEIGNAILSAVNGEGRELYRQRFDSPPGGTRGARLVKLGREVLGFVRESGEVRI